MRMSAFARCDDCRHYWPLGALRVPQDLAERVDQDGEQPAGECPECGALAYHLPESAAEADGADCPNCGHSHAAVDACMVGVVVQMVNDRAEISEPITAYDVALIDADAFWTAAGSLIEFVENHVALKRSQASGASWDGSK